MTANLPVIAHADRAHSAVGGSSAKRVMHCTASVELCSRYPNVESEFAAKGTAMHEAIDLIFQGRTKDDTDIIGLTFNGFEITEEDYREAIAPALEMWDALDKELGGIDYFNERRVVFPDIDNAFGTVDMVGKARDRTIVWDWKFGRGVAVEAERNEQLMYYAYAAAHTPGTAELFDRDKPIELFICQPIVNDGEPFTRWMTTWMQLEAFALELRRAVEKAYSPEAEFALGPWCKFCNGQPGCDLYNNRVRNLGKLTREQLEANLAEYLPMADDMISWGENIKKLAHSLLEQGATIPGFKLVNKRANRSWADEEKALKYFAKVGLPAADRHVKKIVSPKQAEDALKRHGLPAELPKTLVESVSSGTTLAPESDKRPAVSIAPNALKALSERLAGR